MAVLIVGLQYPLWLGKGGWLQIWHQEAQLDDAQVRNEKLRQRNEALQAEVHDLKNGVDAIEERARSELGMVKDNEIFIQVLDTRNPTVELTASEATPASTPVSTHIPPAH